MNAMKMELFPSLIAMMAMLPSLIAMVAMLALGATACPDVRPVQLEAVTYADAGCSSEPPE